MSDITKSVLLKIDIDNADGERRLAEIRDEINKLQESQKNNTRATQEQKDAYEKSAVAIKSLQQEQRNLQGVMVAQNNAAKANKGSFQELYNQWKAAEAQLKNLSGTIQKNEDGTMSLTQEYKDQAAQVDKLKQTLLLFNAGIAQGNLNVGNYGNTLDGMRQKLKDLGVIIQTTDVGTEEFRKAKEEAEKLSTEIQIAEGKIDSMGNKVAKNSIKDTFNDITGATQALSGALGVAMLAAGDNEEAQEKLRKVMGGVALAQTAITIARQKDDIVQAVQLVKTKAQTIAQIALNNATKAFTAIGIVGVLTGIVALFTSFQKKVSATSAAMDKANDTIIEQKTNLDSLLRIARDTNESLEKRRAAVEEINKISPEYLGNLDLEAINTTKAKDAIDAYLESIKSKAEAEATYEILVEKTKELYDLTKDVADGPSFLDLLLGGATGGTSLTSASQQIKDLKKEIEDLTRLYDKANSKSLAPNNTEDNTDKKDASKNTEDLKKEADERERLARAEETSAKAVATWGDIQERNKQILEELKPLYQALFGDEGAAAIEEVVAGTEKLQQGLVGVAENQAYLNEKTQEYQQQIADNIAKMERQFAFAQGVAEQLGQVIGDTLGKSSENVKEFQKELLKMTLTALKNSLMTALAEGLLKELATKGVAGLVTGAIITTAIQAAYATAINGIEGFATGGKIKGGQPIQRSNGDDVLITAKKGEVILNNGQQRRLERMGGKDIWNRLGVPGFADGGFVPRQISGEAAMNVSMSAMRELQDAFRSMPAPVLTYKEFATFERSVQYADKVGGL